MRSELAVRNCVECGNRFEPRTATHIFCTPRCRDRVKNRENSRGCPGRNSVNEITRRILSLGAKLELAMPWERSSLLASIKALQAQEARAAAAPAAV